MSGTTLNGQEEPPVTTVYNHANRSIVPIKYSICKYDNNIYKNVSIPNMNWNYRLDENYGGYLKTMSYFHFGIFYWVQKERSSSCWF